MKVLSLSSQDLIGLHHPVATVGSFDGVHLAHRAILRQVVRRALESGGTGVAITFEPHPQIVLDPQTAPPLLTTTEEKLALLGEMALDVVVLLKFDLDLARMEAGDFIKEILCGKLSVEEIVIGHDHAFGQGRRGRLKTLQEMGRHCGFRVAVMEPIFFANELISSTSIRHKLLAGDVVGATQMLGHRYVLSGRVVAGDGRGRALHYPTANLEISPHKLIPADGVYAIISRRASDVWRGLLNIGMRPTFGGGARRLEIHFLDFQGSLYGDQIEIELVEKIRDERTFADGSQLSQQMREDEQIARRLLASY
jgi:riboflavin kinase/FMN adenylyltransferase